MLRLRHVVVQRAAVTHRIAHLHQSARFASVTTPNDSSSSSAQKQSDAQTQPEHGAVPSEPRDTTERSFAGSVKPQSGFVSADPTKRAVIDGMIRVDHAGEYGAVRIYEGQHAILQNSSVGSLINEMKKHEERHLEVFNKAIRDYRVRPTALLPFWHIGGFLLGAGSALLGKEAAMACTVAVEEVVSEHYNNQLRTLTGTNYEGQTELRKILKEFRDDEMHHKGIGLEQNAVKAPFYSLLTSVIKAGCRSAIWASYRI
mmetsp:Transcript_16566/g.27386  ORF Transcript_16566/g.27386 Transcript_16566/m.27386 type:complete len:258 (-) Transcript_16566:266-1039(-)